jgi:RimJ/RimL family protein N-acetyltransferase
LLPTLRPVIFWAARRSTTSTEAQHHRNRLLAVSWARGRGVAPKVARALAEHAFALGFQRVAAYVDVGNVQSERVLERAGFTREGVVRSLPKSEGRRVDKTLFSLLPGE